MSDTLLYIIICVLLLACGILLHRSRKARPPVSKWPHAGKKIPLPRQCPQIDLALIHSTSRGRYAVDTSGTVHGWPDSLHESVKYLSDSEYVRVNKSFLVAYKVISAFEREASSPNDAASRVRRIYRLVLNIPFNPKVYTTYDNSATVKRKWEILQALKK